jgi:hypothetical protein
MEVHFFGGLRSPYVHIFHDYYCDESGGYVEFTGKYILKEDNNEWFRDITKTLPTNELLFVKADKSNLYCVEIYKKEFIDHYHRTSKLDDENLGEISVCFTPLEHMRLHFRFINKDPSHERPHSGGGNRERIRSNFL